MSLNIKNEQVHELAREASRRTGQNQTSVVAEALRRYLAELDRPARGDDLDSIVARMQEASRRSTEPPFSSDDLYDPETGLPA